MISCISMSGRFPNDIDTQDIILSATVLYWQYEIKNAHNHLW